MKRLILFLFLTFAASAQNPYKATEGNVSVAVLGWSNAWLIKAGLAFGQEIRGIMVSACTRDTSTQVIHTVLQYRKDGETATRIDDVGRLVPMDSDRRCGTILLPVEYKDVVSVVVEEWSPKVSAPFVITSGS